MSTAPTLLLMLVAVSPVAAQDTTMFQHVAWLSEAGMEAGVSEPVGEITAIDRVTEVLASLAAVVSLAEEGAFDSGASNALQFTAALDCYLKATFGGVGLELSAEADGAGHFLVLIDGGVGDWVRLDLGTDLREWRRRFQDDPGGSIQDLISTVGYTPGVGWPGNPPTVRPLPPWFSPPITVGGSCTQGSGCTAGNLCTSMSCTSGTCTSSNCTTAAMCTSGACTSGSVCTNGPGCTNGIGCTDGAACTSGDSCTSGTGCTGVSGVSGCTGGTTCTAGPACTSSSACTDTNCTGFGPACTGGVSCTGGGECTSGDACTDFSCTGGDACTGGDSCTGSGECTGGAGCFDNGTSGPACTGGAACTNGGGCTAGDACTTGQCTNGDTCTGGSTCTAGHSCTSSDCTSGFCSAGPECTTGPKCSADDASMSAHHCGDHGYEGAQPLLAGLAEGVESCLAIGAMCWLLSRRRKQPLQIIAEPV